MTWKKYGLLAGIGIAAALSVTGCAGTQDNTAGTTALTETEPVSPVETPAAQGDADNTSSAKTEQTTADNTSGDAADSVEAEESDAAADTVLSVPDNGQTSEIIGGKVRSVTQDSFVISRTLVDENGFVTMPEAGSPEEQLVTIRCTDETVYELWKIQGGGAGIETSGAAFSDIKEGTGLEAEGYFDGEEFTAEKIIIEIYE